MRLFVNDANRSHSLNKGSPIHSPNFMFYTSPLIPNDESCRVHYEWRHGFMRHRK